jgi:hypothetical protein
MDIRDVQKLIRNGENEITEFKKKAISPKKS